MKRWDFWERDGFRCWPSAGWWIEDKPDCRVNLAAPSTAWPDCANFVHRSRALKIGAPTLRWLREWRPGDQSEADWLADQGIRTH